MGQTCCRPPVCCTFSQGLCCLTTEAQEPKYARYLGTSEDELDLGNIVGDPLELDPVSDRETGEEKINTWIDSNAPHLGLPESDIGINRLKCVKYWEAVLGKDISKLNGSTVNFSFEKKSSEEPVQLVIEHRGKSMFVRNASKRASSSSGKPQLAVSKPLMEQTQPQNDPKETEI